MTERLKDIKETASDAVEIIRELGSPDVQASLEKIRDTAKVGSEIIKSLKDPGMVTNIENIRKTAESFENTSARIERVTMELKNSGVLDETRETIKSAKNTISSVGDSKNMGETMDAIKEMLRSISALVDELKLTVIGSKESGTIHNIEETIRETRSAFTEHK
jgi:anionic cell wall polymer biosynthesis LytR-Cps2A-Psr (LCP) family protein